MSPKSRKICISITIHHKFLGWIKNKTIVLGTLEILKYTLHSRLIWCIGVMYKPVALVNRKGHMWSCVWFHIQHHTYKRSIWVGLISISLRTITVCPKRCLNFGGCWKSITMFHPFGFQDFADQSSLKELKSTIIQCLDINTQELRHWLYLWVSPIVTRTILLEIIHYIINIRLWTCPE